MPQVESMLSAYNIASQNQPETCLSLLAPLFWNPISTHVKVIEKLYKYVST